MTQPSWKVQIASDYFCIFVDTTGVYAPEIEIAEGNEVYRWSLDQLQFNEDGDLCNTHGHKEWFQSCHGGLKSVASSAGRTVRDLENAFASADLMERAHAYMDVAGHHGAINFDQYPLTLTEKQITKRWS